MPFSLDQRNLVMLCLCFSLLISITAILAFLQWREDWQLAHISTVASRVVESAPVQTQSLSAIPDAHLFGAAFTHIGDTPMSNLQLRVTGIVKIDQEKGQLLSKAYISIEGQPSKIYVSGDSLPYGVKVYAITNDAVILQNEGRLEKLPLPREALSFKPKNKEE